MGKELLFQTEDEDFETKVFVRKDTKELSFQQLIKNFDVRPEKVVLTFEEFKKVVEAFNALEL